MCQWECRLHFKVVIFMPLLIIVKNASESHFGEMWSQRSRCETRGGRSETGDVGSWDVTLGCAAKSAGAFFYTLQRTQHNHTYGDTHTFSCTLFLSHTLQTPAGCEITLCSNCTPSLFLFSPITACHFQSFSTCVVPK